MLPASPNTPVRDPQHVSPLDAPGSGTQPDHRVPPGENRRRTITRGPSYRRTDWDGLRLAYGDCGKWIVHGVRPHWCKGRRENVTRGRLYRCFWAVEVQQKCHLFGPGYVRYRRLEQYEL